MAKFILVGPHEGKTIKLDRFEFIDGALEFNGSPQDIQTIAFHLGTYYSAFHESVVEIARKKFAESQGIVVEQPQSLFAAKPDPYVAAQVQQTLPADLAPQVPPIVIANVPLTTPVASTPAATETDPLDVGDSKPETVADALQGLDPEKDADWTSRGLPSVDVVSALLGRAVTRDDIEAAAAGYTRAAAKAAKAA